MQLSRRFTVYFFVIIVPLLLNLSAFILLCISLIIYKADNLTLEEDIMAIKQEKGV